VKYRKKPVVIEAVQWTGVWDDDISSFLPAKGTSFDAEGELHIRTLDGVMAAGVGDWIIKGVKGEFYPCKPDIFAETYEAVEP